MIVEIPIVEASGFCAYSRTAREDRFLLYVDRELWKTTARTDRITDVAAENCLVYIHVLCRIYNVAD